MSAELTLAESDEIRLESRAGCGSRSRLGRAASALAVVAMDRSTASAGTPGANERAEAGGLAGSETVGTRAFGDPESSSESNDPKDQANSGVDSSTKRR
jgi:hypothetical protein